MIMKWCWHIVIFCIIKIKEEKVRGSSNHRQLTQSHQQNDVSGDNGQGHILPSILNHVGKVVSPI